LIDRGAWAAANPMLGETLNTAHLAALVKLRLSRGFARFHLNELMLDGAWLPTGQMAAAG
jgi:hypothetical protein